MKKSIIYGYMVIPDGDNSVKADQMKALKDRLKYNRLGYLGFGGFRSCL